MDRCKFFGAESAAELVRETIYSGIQTPLDLYDALKKCWCAETCAPRMRRDWSEDDPTLGQCSVTSFLVQDLFGGMVYGIPLEDGNYHCFNVVGDTVFDLTSEQFSGRILDYELNHEQTRARHFLKAEKKERYELLSGKLARLMKEK